MEDSVAMNGGHGPNSYTKNSKYQKEGSDRAKDLLINGIKEKLIIQDNSNALGIEVFRIADLGCSVGPNTFTCVETIVQAVQNKFKTQGLDSRVPEFQVFFNDNVTNDFNTLFKSLPLQRQYMAAGVPGSFYDRLFPKASMNLMHSSFAIHWLARIPEEVTKEDAPAWNKGSITCISGCNEVVEAFRAQFLRDMDAFLKARSLELVEDGLLMMLMPCRPDGSRPSEDIHMIAFDLAGRVLYDMAKEGVVSEALIDSFNVPVYIPTSSEVTEVISSNENFSIEILEKTYHTASIITREEARVGSFHARATMEGILCKHFGSEIIDELFERYTDKMHEFSKTPTYTRVKTLETLFLLVKRNKVSQ